MSTRGLKPEHRRTLELALVAALGFYVAFLGGRMGWFYHSIPAMGVVLLMLGVLAASPRQHFTATPGRARLVARVSLGLFAILLAWGTLRFRVTVPSTAEPLIGYARKHMAGKRIMFLSTSGFDFLVYPYANVRVVNRFPSLWMLPGILKLLDSQHPEVRAQTRQDLDFIVKAITTDLKRGKPEWVIIDTRPDNKQLLGPRFNYVEFLSRSPQFRRLWTDYRFHGETRHYEYYRRRSATTTP